MTLEIAVHPLSPARSRPVVCRRPVIRVLAGLLLLIVSIGVFLPTYRHDFVHFDDQQQVIDNPKIRSLSPGSLVEMFTSASVDNYYPVRLLSFAVDYHFWGTEAGGYHLTNVLLHGANALLLFGLMLRLFGDRATGERGGHVWRKPGAALLGTLLFAVHPVVVEPVAWISGREELLMTFFGLLSIHGYVSARRSERTGRRRWMLVGSMGMAACALMCNVMAASLPLILGGVEVAVFRPRRWASPIWRLLPFGLLSGGAIVLILMIESAHTEMILPHRLVELEGIQRITVVPHVFWKNIQTLVWPKDLSLDYAEAVPASFMAPSVLLGMGAGVGVVWGLWLLRRHKAAMFGLLWTVAALAPSAQIFPHFYLRADRYLYLPLAGVSLLLGAALLGVMFSRLRLGWLIPVMVGVHLLALGWHSSAQALVWYDDQTLFNHIIRVNPESEIAYNALGLALEREGRTREAARKFEQAIEIAPDYGLAYNNLGTVYQKLGRMESAERAYRKAIEQHFDHPHVHSNLGHLLYDTGRYEEALQHLNRALEAEPGLIQALYNKSLLLVDMGQPEQAAQYLRKILDLRPHLDLVAEELRRLEAHQRQHNR
mgnify:FL=1